MAVTLADTYDTAKGEPPMPDLREPDQAEDDSIAQGCGDDPDPEDE